MVSSLSQLSFFFFFLFTTLCNSQPYLQLPLLHIHPSPTPTQALSSDSLRLSLLHSRRRRRSAASPVVSGASTGSGQYFVHLRLGSPPQPLLLVADTGSDLVWLRCSACKSCSRRLPGSAFLARHSSTFSPFHCYDSACSLVPGPDPNPCNHTGLHSPCRYSYSYSDGSTTAGFFSREATTLNTSSGAPAKLSDLAFGCGFDVSGPSLTGPNFGGAQGVMGLGRGPISFASQLGRRFGNTFSYCLLDYTLSPPPTSYLRIGVPKSDVVSKLSYTRLLLNPLSPTFYYIGIKSVSVNGVKLPVRSSVWALDKNGDGGTVIDSGTTLTFLPEQAYRLILTAFKRSLKQVASPAEPTPGFDLCVNVSGLGRARLPRLSFALVGGSVFAPPPRNYFIETMDRVECLAIQPVDSGSGFSVIGNLMQQGFLFEFDKDRSRLGFSRHGCALQ
ncbi:PREDICTED: protein ASPARTIC PROTEASE IN GUARD CELL 2 [Fragaria vesca subsp. vesca]|uniref:protein ASPARTIC PROTEASE IN GUARD CELL 2 n=1 Tax=Fragaria vesca subsp. vesca TaxID=101020 RepID=UPI0002C2E7D0|nr:PREDICTED: protein ASPARTIC PROTEASE IN GUARD CELL 2 [Fragaria vesca subsp. vesca]